MKYLQQDLKQVKINQSTSETAELTTVNVLKYGINVQDDDFDEKVWQKRNILKFKEIMSCTNKFKFE